VHEKQQRNGRRGQVFKHCFDNTFAGKQRRYDHDTNHNQQKSINLQTLQPIHSASFKMGLSPEYQ
jgi:hypothetical protein